MTTDALTVRQFCEKYATGRTKAYELIASGYLTCKKLGRRTLITATSAQAWFDNLPSKL